MVYQLISYVFHFHKDPSRAATMVQGKLMINVVLTPHNKTSTIVSHYPYESDKATC